MIEKSLAVTAAVLAACAVLTAAEKGVKVPASSEVLATLVKGHPRLVLTERRLAELKKLAGTDALLAKGVKDVLRQADATAKKPPLVYHKVGPRLLHVSRECMHRMYTLGLAWRWTGKAKYADKARADLLAVCDFADWNPSHFLDTAEMSHAVAIGYDWFFSALDEPTRDRIRRGLIRNGLEPGVKAYAGKGAWWARSEFNWNQVCNFGLTIGALGIAETDGSYAERIVPAAVASAPKALASYAPDGAWAEGPGYWGYATRYTVYGLAALETALGTDFGLSKVAGLSRAGYFPLYTAGPTGYYFNFADVGGRSRLRNQPALFWLARRYRNPFFAAAERKMMAGGRAEATDVIWYVPPAAEPAKAELARLFRGPVEVAVFRSAWDDANALFVGVKAGYNQVNHGHLDLGAFELDALGVRWARELGSDDYNLPGYWGMSANARRWKYYRLGSLSHNIPLLDDANQDVRAVAKVERFVAADGANGFVVIDLGQAYRPAATSARRGVRMLAGRAVLVQDELDLARRCQAAWGLTTDAKIALSPDGAAATLTLAGRTLVTRLLSPAGAKFASESAERKPPEADNKGARRLVARVAAGKGPLRWAVLLEPQWPDGKQAKTPELVPLADWK